MLESLLQQETSSAWGRLLQEGSDSGMSMMSGPSPTPRPPPSPTPPGPSPTPRPPPSPTTPPTQARTLLAVGDSLCAGQLPEPKNTILFSDEAYVDTLFEYLQENYDFDTLEKVCCSAEDSYELINASANPPTSDGSICYPDQESGVSTQLDAAVVALQSGNNDIGLITISIGANDIFPCGFAANPEECVTSQLQKLIVNLQTILTTLTEASTTTPPPPIIAMTPYNAYLAFYLSDVEQEQALVPVSILSSVVVQTETTKLYNAFNVPVVGGNDVFDGLNNSTVNGVPQNVINICRYTGMCEETESGEYVLLSAELRDIHPFPEGSEKLGQAHFDVVDELLQ